MTAAAGAGVASPCVNVCRMEGDYCVGCWRSLDEIACWSRASDERRRLILAAVAQRRQLLDPATGPHADHD